MFNLTSWLGRLGKPFLHRTRSSCQRKSTRTLLVERLEDRTVPSASLAAGGNIFPPFAGNGIEGQQVPAGTTLFRFLDPHPSARATDFRATITWGDGTPTDSVTSTSTAPATIVSYDITRYDVVATAGSHTYSRVTGGTFTVEVRDIASGRSTGPISFSPLNMRTVPAVVTGTRTLTVPEGDAATITTALISASAAGQAASTLVYTITTPPTHGQLTLSGSPTTSFTQNDIDLGSVSYISDGSESSSDGFGFTVEYPGGAPATGLFTIQVNPVNDAPQIDYSLLYASDFEGDLQARPSWVHSGLTPWISYQVASIDGLEREQANGNSYLVSEGPWEIDSNHAPPGAGYVHISAAAYLGELMGNGRNLLDMRDGRFRVKVQADDLVLPSGAHLYFWFQSFDPVIGKFVNYLNVAHPLELSLQEGAWTDIDIPLTTVDSDWLSLGSSEWRTDVYGTSATIADALSAGPMDFGVFIFLGPTVSETPATGRVYFDDMELHVAPDRDRPIVVQTLHLVNQGYVPLDVVVGVSDTDSPNFDGGQLTVTYTEGGGIQDNLSIWSAGHISFNGAYVRYDGVVFGTVTGGAAGTDLTVRFNRHATAAVVQALIANLSFCNNAVDPELLRTIAIEFDDGDGGRAQVATIPLSVVNSIPTDLYLSTEWVPEYRPAGTVVGLLATVDADLTNAFTYTLVAGAGSTDNAAFRVQGEQLLTNGVFDATLRSTYSVRVRSTDLNGNTLEKALTITVADDPRLERRGRSLSVTSLSTTDVFSFSAEVPNQYTLLLNGVALGVDGAVVDTIVFVGNGNAVATLIAGSGTNSISMEPGRGTLRGNGYLVTVSGCLTVNAFATGNDDTAHLYDSAGNDSFVGGVDVSYLIYGGDQTHYGQVDGFATVYAYSSAGRDTAVLVDAASNDNFVGWSNVSYLTYGTRPNHYNQVYGFDLVYAYSSGGQDTAQMFDSPGADSFVGGTDFSYLIYNGDQNHYNQVSGFDRVFAYSSAGQDIAELHDSPASDTFAGYTGVSYLAYGDDPSHYNQVYGFDTVLANSGGGNDTANLYDSAGDDEFVGGPQVSYLLYGGGGGDHYNKITGFAKVYAYSTSGLDTATILDSAGDDSFTGWHTVSNLAFGGNANHFNRLYGFARVYVPTSGGSDTAILYGSPTDDSFVVNPTSSFVVYGAHGKSNKVDGFRSVYAIARGGVDILTRFDETGDSIQGVLSQNLQFLISGAAS